MELFQLVTSLETSKRLKELGIEQESLFYWHETDTGWIITNGKFTTTGDYYSAFISSELGEILPLFEVRKKGPDYFRSYSSLLKEDDYFMSDENNMAESMGKLYIYLKENNLVGPA